ncbi:PssE/Cps14G family polysaccharide biosynthesis glycosyltransferase [Natronogracilivirga saccharolytica]|uniref:Glycosyl transferase family 28 C-terminal domain-containing protein n=1 Tax=Natronogracilivirga saccharolytica TaxID=2812953 RepID=A0A8J7SBH3_9BACT|nr:PssE/Cps14G family polysaccharide biosynthesis glycosyltransferase [Natronogracilivirga saccharolytica]MBP3194018.1 hypothetical protein [Natronogracilivirga saccharolytica]
MKAFVTIGTGKSGFYRLLKHVEQAINNNLLRTDSTIQIGGSDYIPKSGNIVRYLNEDEYFKEQVDAEIIISHGGTGSITSALKLKKKVIVVPRLHKFNEHLDDHQLEITRVFEKKGYIMAVYDIGKLDNVISNIHYFQPEVFQSGTGQISTIIEDFISRNI